jgi:hypothetical protein
MKTFKEFVSERMADPVNLAQRTSRIYGKKEKYGKWLTAEKGGHIPLKSYKSKEADSVFNRYDKVTNKIGGNALDNNNVEGRKKIQDTFSSKEMKISELTPTQPFVRTNDIEQLKNKVSEKYPSNIRIATHKGKHYILDGHHAIMAAQMRGEKSVQVKHINLDEYAK